MKIIKYLVILRQFLVRAYGWIQVPGMILMMVGILAPYIKQVINIDTWMIVVICFTGLIIIGFLDYKFGVHTEELNYGTRRNQLLLLRFDKIDKALESIQEGKNEKN